MGCRPTIATNDSSRLLAGEVLPLVAANCLQQPIFALDLARLILSVHGNPNTKNRIFNAAGPDVIVAQHYYEMIAEALGVPLRTRELSISECLAESPSAAVYICHRVYDMSRAKQAGLRMPATPIEQGLREHVASLRSQVPRG